MNRSFIDDNGNPCDNEEEEEGQEQGDREHNISPPKYFINAAELVEDDIYLVPEEYKDKDNDKPERVSETKSYPSITQKERKMEKEESQDNLADSLENLSILEQEETFKTKGKSILESSALMTESQMCGIIGEKPPEAWTIDLNSLDSSDFQKLEMETSRKSMASSNPNSLSFFVNFDKGEEEGEQKESESSMTSSSTKIFSMFVDIKDKDKDDKNKSSSSGIPKRSKDHHPNTMTQSTESLKGKQCNAKAVAEAMRKATREEWEKYNQKITTTTSSEGMESWISNRSSLHVANVLESSYESCSMIESQSGDTETCQSGPCLKLGMDLLKMFQEGINTDVKISVNGKCIKAHKCILASRSQYFAAILSGQWIEKAGNTIKLDGYSYAVVQFALYHIYSGTNEIPDSIDLLELAALTDLLGLEGLRDNIGNTFKVKFCHNFHRPCTGCITGVLECFPIAANYGMDELQRKIMKWICKHFVRIWPTKGFSSLGEDMMIKCLQYSVNHLSVDNILDHTLGCDQLLTTMPTLRWTEPIFNMVNQLGEECVQFLGENMSEVLQSQKFLQFGKGQAWNISRIEGTFMQAMTLLKPEMACLSHAALSRLIELGTEAIDEVEWSTSFVDFLTLLKEEVEKYLLANASKAVLSKSWEELDPKTRKKICSTSLIGVDKYGNKIVKNVGPAIVQHQPNVSRVQGQSKDKDKDNRRTTKPMQSVKPVKRQADETSKKDVPRTLSTTVGRSNTMSSTGSSEQERTITKDNKRPATTGSGNRKIQPQTSSTRRASTSQMAQSPCRTPSKPSTPSVPSKSSLSLDKDQDDDKKKKLMSAMERNRMLARQACKPPPEPPKKTFLSNSAKAAAVSKPILKPRKEYQVSQEESKPSTPTPPQSRQSSANARALKAKVEYNPPSQKKRPATTGTRKVPAQTSSKKHQQTKDMSKSTIEGNDGEPRIRTLAEIGRSSTFSKDEPTILGKMDLGGNKGYQYEDDYESDYDD